MKKQVFNLSEIKGIFPLPLRERVRVRGKRVAFTLSEVDSSSPNKGRLGRVSIGNNCKSIPIPSLIREGGAKLAFTLAEVLITLGVIGVVAAITMPTLISNYQKHVTINRLKQTYTILYGAIKKSEADNGDLNLWDFELHDWQFFSKYLFPYLKIVDTKYIDSLKNNGYLYKLANGGNADEYGFYRRQVYINTLANGVQLIIIRDNDSVLSHLIYLDLNGINTQPNKLGRDFFCFQLWKDYGLVASGMISGNWDKNPTSDRNNIQKTQYACKKGVGSGYYCAALILMDGWKISKDYPW